MGVYHFMGLGRSVGVVTAAISYLAARYDRYNNIDQEFFALSGEVNQETQRGDAQALVLFTTPEVREGQPNGLCQEYIDNRLGTQHGQTKQNQPMSRELKSILSEELLVLSNGRSPIDIYWCDIDRADLGVNFERVVRVLSAAKPPGEIGKEIWINITGGSNVVNTALQLATSLIGSPARLYYLQADNIKLARPALPLADIGSAKDRFWVELPIVYLAFDGAHRAVLEELQALPNPISENDLLERLKNGRQWDKFQELNLQAFRRAYLIPLRSQQLLLWKSPSPQHIGQLKIGPRWKAFQSYYTAIDQGQSETLAELAERESWFHAERWVL